MNREESASPTAALESVMIKGVINTQEHQDAATVDIPNAFAQVHTKHEPGNEWVTMEIQGVLVNVLVKFDPGLCEGQVVCKNGEKTVCIIALKAICVMLQSALLFYKQFRSDLEAKDCKFNPCNPCVANKKVCGKQHTMTFHVDDLKCSHVCKKANNCFTKWLDTKCGDDEIGRVKAIRGKHHDCLGMKLDFSTKGKLKVDMRHCVKDVVEDFPCDFKSTDTVLTPANENLFSVDNSKLLDKT